MSIELGEDDKATDSLTPAEAHKYLAKIQHFTNRVMEMFTTKDPASGRAMLNLNDRTYDITMQREKDKFYLETGLTIEQVHKYLKKQQAELNPSMLF